MSRLPPSITEVTTPSNQPKFPSRLTFNPDALPKLDSLQAGHLRHFHNQASQRDGSWDLMGEQIVGQEWLTAFRYQLSHMFYAAALAHFHRLPAARSVFQVTLRRLIHKMLLPHVWNYWYLTSQSGKRVDPDITELRKPWADPVVRENIMYSGHLLLMVAQYSMLFDDDSYDEPGAITFLHNPIFWGMGPEEFKYTRSSLQDAIVTEMARNDWLGVCCEPNCIFVICNQFPLLAIGYNDKRRDTKLFPEVTTKYMAAWAKKGFTDQQGFIVDWYALNQSNKISRSSFGTTSWCTAFMNAWNPDFSHQEYEDKKPGFLVRTTRGDTSIQPAFVAFDIRSRLANGTLTIEEASSASAAIGAWEEGRRTGNMGRIGKMHMTEPVLGYVLLAASEMGDSSVLSGLHRQVEHHNPPQWSRGGLYYALHEMEGNPYNEDGEWVAMDAFCGNACMGYSRLNVEDGQKKMFEGQWTREYHQTKPFIDGLTLDDGVDVLRAVWVEEQRAMVMTFRSWNGEVQRLNLRLKNLPNGPWARYDSGQLVAQGWRTTCDIELSIRVGARDCTVVVVIGTA